MGLLVEVGKLEERPCLGVKVTPTHSPSPGCSWSIRDEWVTDSLAHKSGPQGRRCEEMADLASISREVEISHTIGGFFFIYCCINPISNCNVNFMKIQLKSEFIDLSLLSFLPQFVFVRTNLFPLSMLSKVSFIKTSSLRVRFLQKSSEDGKGDWIKATLAF